MVTATPCLDSCSARYPAPPATSSTTPSPSPPAPAPAPPPIFARIQLHILRARSLAPSAPPPPCASPPSSPSSPPLPIHESRSPPPPLCMRSVSGRRLDVMTRRPCRGFPPRTCALCAGSPATPQPSCSCPTPANAWASTTPLRSDRCPSSLRLCAPGSSLPPLVWTAATVPVGADPGTERILWKPPFRKATMVLVSHRDSTVSLAAARLRGQARLGSQIQRASTATTSPRQSVRATAKFSAPTIPTSTTSCVRAAVGPAIAPVLLPSTRASDCMAQASAGKMLTSKNATFL